MSVIFKKNGKLIGSLERGVYTPEPGEEWTPPENRPAPELFALKTDKMLWYSGCRERMSDGELAVHAERVKAAEAAGVSTTGKRYFAGLADKPRDPTAWASDYGDVRRIAREKNLTLTGSIEQKGVDLPPPEPVEIAPDIVERRVYREMCKNPDANVNDIRERETALASGKIKRNDARCGNFDLGPDEQ